MSNALSFATRPGRPVRSPGVYIEDRGPEGAGAPAMMTGVPAFVGFAAPDTDAWTRSGTSATVIDRWNGEAFARSVRPATGSFLPLAVRGFFANGGKRCIVLAVPPAAGSAGLQEVFQRGGPLDDRSDTDLVCVPDAAVGATDEGNDSYQVLAAALAHCEAMGDRFAILDVPRMERGATQRLVDDVLAQASLLRSAFGALYFPWIGVDPRQDEDGSAAPAAGSQEWRRLPRAAGHPGSAGPIQFGPACGHIAGLYARIDALVGPQRSPASERLDGAVDTAVLLNDRQHGLLNAGGVNCLRSLRGHGIEVGGARTRSGHSSWAYVSTARVILGFRRWLAVGMRDLVFEPQTPALWDRIRRRLVARCLELLRSGALAGADAADAFFVKCDAETNGPDEVDLGRVVALVGLAPSVPAEFIIVRIEHDPGGVAVSILS